MAASLYYGILFPIILMTIAGPEALRAPGALRGGPQQQLRLLPIRRLLLSNSNGVIFS